MKIILKNGQVLNADSIKIKLQSRNGPCELHYTCDLNKAGQILTTFVETIIDSQTYDNLNNPSLQ